MIKTYVLNMEKDIHKRTLIESQLECQTNLEVVLFKAIEGKKLTSTDLDKWVNTTMMNKRYNNFSTLPAIGCSLSHWNVYSLMVENNDKYALILEDDAILSPSISLKIKKIETLLLSAQPTIILLTPEFVYSPQNQISEFNDFKLYNLNGNGTMASGYIVNYAAAKLLKKELLPIRFLADHWSEIAKVGIKMLGVVPHLISYPKGLGEIGTSQQNNYKRSRIQRLRHYVAGIKGKAYVLFFINMRNLKISSKNW